MPWLREKVSIPALGTGPRMIRSLQIGILAAAALACSACAVVTVDGSRLHPGSDAFADYVESVFRRQNEILSELAFAIDAQDSGSDRYAALEGAEGQVLEQCDGLNALASATQRGERTGGLGALAAARRAPDCERATRAARALLDSDVHG